MTRTTDACTMTAMNQWRSAELMILFRNAGTVFKSALLSVACFTGTLLFTPSVAAQSLQDRTAKPVIFSEHINSVGLPVTDEPRSSWPTITSRAAVVMDMTTGTLVYEKAPLAPHYPASLTKVMTALLALSHGHLTDTLTASQAAVDQPPDKLYLVPGESESLQSLLTAMLVDSDNDVALEVAQNYAGSSAHFAEWMNQEAKSLGALHTHFVNPSGLPNNAQVTTAYDMALITRAAMQNPDFRTMVATREITWHGEAWSAKLVNLNSMLFSYRGAIGVKTGWTTQANETLAVAATRGSTTFLAILLDARLASEIDSDATSLLNYAFAHYHTTTVLPVGTVLGTLTAADGHKISVKSAAPVLATVAGPATAKPVWHLRLTPPSVSRPIGSIVGQAVVSWRGENGDVPVAITKAWRTPHLTTTKNHPVLHVFRKFLWGLFGVLFLAFISRGIARKVARRRRLARWR